MDAAQTFAAAGHVVTCEVGRETVLLDKEAGLYFGLDAVGTRMWQLLTTGLALAMVCDVLEAEFDVCRDRLEHDLETLARELSARRLIVAAPLIKDAA